MSRDELNRLDRGAWEAYHFGRGLLVGWGTAALGFAIAMIAVFGR